MHYLVSMATIIAILLMLTTITWVMADFDYNNRPYQNVNYQSWPGGYSDPPSSDVTMSTTNPGSLNKQNMDQIIRILREKGIDTRELEDAIRRGDMQQVSSILSGYRNLLPPGVYTFNPGPGQNLPPSPGMSNHPYQ